MHSCLYKVLQEKVQINCFDVTQMCYFTVKSTQKSAENFSEVLSFRNHKIKSVFAAYTKPASLLVRQIQDQAHAY